VLDDVERRRFLVQPAGEGAVELPARVADVELDERAGQLLRLPRRGGLAGAQADDDVADPDRLARLQGQLLRNTVALVEQAENGDPLRHRRRPRRFGRHGLRNIDGPRLGGRLVVALGAAAALAATGQGEPGCDEGEERPQRRPHAWSGVQA
jgi:hypothetical protein